MNKKLMILAIVTVMVSLISLGGSQVLSKGPGFKANYNADITVGETGNGIEGNVDVEWSRGRFISSELYEIEIELEFVESESGFWMGFYGTNFAGTHGNGWLSMLVDRGTGRALFEFRWKDIDAGKYYDLNGHGSFDYNKKTKVFTFQSDGEYEIVQWFPPPSSPPLWTGPLEFTVTGTPIED